MQDTALAKFQNHIFEEIEMRKLVLLVLLLALLTTVAIAQDTVTLVLLVDDGETNLAQNQALVDAYMALNPNVSIEIETRPGGADWDNIV